MELKQIRHVVYLRSLTLSFTIFTTRLALFLSVLVNIYLGNSPTAYYVFVVTAFYNIVRVSVTMSLPMAIGQFVELNISIKRIKKILMLQEMTYEIDTCAKQEPQQVTNKLEIRVTLENAVIGEDFLLPEKRLNDVNFTIYDKELVVIAGPVGSGKTSLLQTILKEIPTASGKVSVLGSVSYAAQEPWLFSGTIEQNILFGNAMNIQRYQEVVKVCALETDFNLLSEGDLSIVGERGTTLSGGQKARLGLARAIYKEADIYLLDDPLSAVDTHVGKQLFQECIRTFLKDKTVILVTHQLQYIRTADRLMLVENGNVSVEEASANLQKIGQRLDSEIKSQENKDDLSLLINFNEKKGGNQRENNATAPKEHRSVGSISKKVYKNYISAGGGFLTIAVILIWFFVAQSMANAGDYFITLW